MDGKLLLLDSAFNICNEGNERLLLDFLQKWVPANQPSAMKRL